MADPKISIRNLYKIFGSDSQMALKHAKEGMHKTELLEQHRHVLGLRDINVDMQAGEITVIMGLSGSGKSTLIRHLNRLIDPTDGEVWVEDSNIMTYSDARLREMRRKKMSMVFQKFALLPHRTVLENAATPMIVDGAKRADWEKEATRWLDRVGLEGQGPQYPHQLSGGMQQRVGIAQALTSNSDIMLMDEAFSALDPLIRTDMQDLLIGFAARVAEDRGLHHPRSRRGAEARRSLGDPQGWRGRPTGRAAAYPDEPERSLHRGLHLRHQPRPRSARPDGDEENLGEPGRHLRRSGRQRHA